MKKNNKTKVYGNMWEVPYTSNLAKGWLFGQSFF